MAEVGYGLRRTLSCNDEIASSRRPPDAGHSQQLLREWILLHQTPVSMNVFRLLQIVIAQLLKGLLHWVEGILLRGQNAVLYDLMNAIRKGARNPVEAPELAGGKKLLHSHSILCECAGLVGAEHCGCAQRLHCGDPACENSILCDPPGTHSQENSQDDGKLFRQY